MAANTSIHTSGSPQKDGNKLIIKKSDPGKEKPPKGNVITGKDLRA